MATITSEVIQKIYAAVDYMSGLEGQDKQLTLDMSQAMLNDVIELGHLKPMIEYVNYYCDVIDFEHDGAEGIAANM